MKKATLSHDDLKGFVLLDESNVIICAVDAGSNTEEPDWALVEKQANEAGYTIY